MKPTLPTWPCVMLQAAPQNQSRQMSSSRAFLGIKDQLCVLLLLGLFLTALVFMPLGHRKGTHFLAQFEF